ncbi:MAG: ROK family protein [Clostridia bacterium]|nr:ROK family protein [Clostridia bacterium]
MNSAVGNSQLIQKMNRLKVLNYIRRNPDTARPMIARETGLALSSITNITSYLLGIGLLTESGMEKADRVGRKGTLLRFCKNAYSLVCISFDPGHITIAYTNLEGNIEEKININSDNIQPRDAAELLIEKLLSLISRKGRGKILGIGIAISGLVLDGSRFVASTSLKWKEFDLKAILEKETGLPVFIENASLLKAVWYFCCDRQIYGSNMVLVDMMNGIGSCQYYNGEINRAMLGEIGHTTVENNGEPCFCGNRGCLEAMCSPQRIAKLYQGYTGNENADFDYVIEQFGKNEEAAKRAVEECAQYLGIGLANLVNICKPSVAAINMGSFEHLPEIIDIAEAEMRKRVYTALLEDFRIEKISVTYEQSVRGAAFSLCDRLFDISYPYNIVE